ncbi:hypothetical protein RIF29_38965 [Crotalaria pallida]|uniref:Ribonuclease H1 N-terminal domain-containing protein n=1 Tax=Crotalaria pallida TaxID=3830 RepID=A0AAN9E6J5_CROPI
MSNGTRRWYVVFVGRRPGYYKTWEQCQQQIDGFKGSHYQSYVEEDEAEIAWVDHLIQQGHASANQRDLHTSHYEIAQRLMDDEYMRVSYVEGENHVEAEKSISLRSLTHSGHPRTDRFQEELKEHSYVLTFAFYESIFPPCSFSTGPVYLRKPSSLPSLSHSHTDALARLRLRPSASISVQRNTQPAAHPSHILIDCATQDPPRITGRFPTMPSFRKFAEETTVDNDIIESSSNMFKPTAAISETHSE